MESVIIEMDHDERDFETEISHGKTNYPQRHDILSSPNTVEVHYESF